jgi:hypothetical protein
MRDRWVDIALISALVLISGTIVFTLFGRPTVPRVQSGASPVSAEAQPLEVQPTEVQPIEVQSVENQPNNSPTPEGIVAVEPEQNGAGVQAQAAQAPEVTLTEPETAEEETPRLPVPEGTIDLERVGFSFVTGGTGSCNIVLEPWQHVAVSLDLREKYPCGSEITVTLDEEVAGRTSFKAIVADSIRNAERTVNVYVGQDEPALEYGIKDGQLSP